MEARKFEFLHMTIQAQLLRQLIHFGLNPKEWHFHKLSIEPENKRGAAELVHHQDQNLRLKGTVQKRPNLPALIAWEWRELTWDF